MFVSKKCVLFNHKDTIFLCNVSAYAETLQKNIVSLRSDLNNITDDNYPSITSMSLIPQTIGIINLSTMINNRDTQNRLTILKRLL